MKGFAFAALVVLALSCSTPKTRNDAPVAAPGQSVALTREEAFKRAKQIGPVAYVAWFGLDDEDSYEGRSVINFEVRPKAKEYGSEVFIDFRGGTITHLTVNSKPFNDFAEQKRYDGNRIRFQLSELYPGSNRVEIAFTQKYATDGNGLHRFKDPLDGKTYIYSNLEPYAARKVFPCFDQPDMKGSLELTVDAPDHWVVISNTDAREISAVQGRKIHAFPPSPLLPSYVFALHAGEYASWKSEADGIPMSLYARKSLAQYVDHKEWFEITRRGLVFFNHQYGYPYPYAKYDQIIVPEFNPGAMENAGAVTFSERFISRGKVTTDWRRDRADTILHEMAHMWFGDLVTMRWWNGLWLNESFASYMSAWATDKSTDFKGTWQSFFAGMKLWAYWEDQLVTTHPIETPVPDTDHAETVFDGITYGKGASALKQLAYFLGEDDFREGVQRYFERFALSNTSLSDFIRMLSEASERDLTKWQRQWLQTSGVNTLRADWACDAGGKVSQFKLVQGFAEQGDQELRSHRTEVALFKAGKDGKLRKSGDAIPVSYSAAETAVGAAIGQSCPDFVFPNFNDHDYALVELDPRSLQTAKDRLAKLEDPFVRQMAWHSLSEMLFNAKLSAGDYFEIALKQVGSETDTQVLDRVLGSLISTRASSNTALRFMTGAARDSAWSRLEKFSWEKLQKAAPGSDLQLEWFSAFMRAARSEARARQIQELLKGTRKISGLRIDQERRWSMIQALARMGASNAADLIAAERKKDPTETGERSAIAAEASMPSAENKKLWLDRILKREGYSTAKLKTAMRSVHVFGQQIPPELVETYYREAPRIAGVDDTEYAETFVRAMRSGECDAASIARVSSLLGGTLPAHAQKSLKIARQEEERCLKARGL